MRISIDPGIGGSGWAIWDMKWNLLDYGVLELKGGDEFDKLKYITNNLKDICKKTNVKYVYIEYPQVFQTNIALSGALTKLAYGVGVIAGSLFPRKVELIRVLDWKGNLPKEVVIKRIKQRMPDIKADSHAWDAIGIGLYKKGIF